jgi:hypothetical protein
MKSILLSLLGTSFGIFVANSVFAESKVKEFYSNDSLGCMILRECTENVRQINSISDIASYYPDSDFSLVSHEFNSMLLSLNKVGVMVFLGPEKYFPSGHRGVYHTISNKLYLNDSFMHRPEVLMDVMRHEGWHAAQDCMAGSIDNSMISIIYPEDKVPRIWREIVEKTYSKDSVPWEAEAKWAGKTEGMTLKALKVCASGSMWEVYPPTPLTKQWLRQKGYIK